MTLLEGRNAEINKVIEEGKANYKEVLERGKEAAEDM